MPLKKKGWKYRKDTEVNDLVNLLQMDQRVIIRTKLCIKNNPNLVAGATVEYIDSSAMRLGISKDKIQNNITYQDEPFCKNTEMFANKPIWTDTLSNILN